MGSLRSRRRNKQETFPSCHQNTDIQNFGRCYFYVSWLSKYKDQYGEEL